MVPSTGYLRGLVGAMEKGLSSVFHDVVLQNKFLSCLLPKLLSTFRQYGNWLERLGIDSVGSLNDSIQAGNIREIILVSEALHDLQISDITQRSLKSQMSHALFSLPDLPLPEKPLFPNGWQYNCLRTVSHHFPWKWTIIS